VLYSVMQLSTPVTEPEIQSEVLLRSNRQRALRIPNWGHCL